MNNKNYISVAKFVIVIYILLSLASISFAANKSNPLAPGDISITNNIGIYDEIAVSNIVAGDIIKVYRGQKKTGIIATTRATTTSANISIKQLGTAAGNVYITRTSTGLLESDVVEASYAAESTNSIPQIDSNNITKTITNGKLTGIKINYLNGTVVTINVYGVSTGGALLNTFTTRAGTILATCTFNTPYTYATLPAGGTLYIVLEIDGVEGSTRTAVSFTQSGAITGTITPQYTSGKLSGVTVDTLLAGDIIYVYDKDSNLVGKSSKVANGKTSVTAAISKPYANAVPGTQENIYVTRLVKTADLESGQATSSFDVKSAVLPGGDITIANNYGVASTITVANLSAGDKIKVYQSDGTTLIGSAAVAAGKTSAVFSTKSLTQGVPGTLNVGSVKISVIRKNKTESDQVQKQYNAIIKTSTPTAIASSWDYLFTNDSGGATLIVKALAAQDIITVYGDDGNGGQGTKITSGTVGAGKTVICITFAARKSGNHIFVTRQNVSAGNAESDALDITVS